MIKLFSISRQQMNGKPDRNQTRFGQNKQALYGLHFSSSWVGIPKTFSKSEIKVSNAVLIQDLSPVIYKW